MLVTHSAVTVLLLRLPSAPLAMPGEPGLLEGTRVRPSGAGRAAPAPPQRSAPPSTRETVRTAPRCDEPVNAWALSCFPALRSLRLVRAQLAASKTHKRAAVRPRRLSWCNKSCRAVGICHPMQGLELKNLSHPHVLGDSCVLRCAPHEYSGKISLRVKIFDKKASRAIIPACLWLSRVIPSVGVKTWPWVCFSFTLFGLSNTIHSQERQGLMFCTDNELRG